MDLDNTDNNSQPMATSNATNNNNSNRNNNAQTAATTTGNNCSIPTSACVLKSNYDTDLVRLIGQQLVDMGLKQTVNLLLEETGLQGLDHPLASRFQQNILAGEWDQASALIEELVDLVIATNQQQQRQPLCQYRANLEPAAFLARCATGISGQPGQMSQLELDRMRCINEMRVAIAEQKFLELIEDRQHIKALKCLRLEITPLCGDEIKNVKQLANLIMCRSTEEVRLKANWPGKGLQSRQMLVGRLQRYIPPLILLPLKRLSTLLNQAKQLQEERCLLHMKHDDDCNNAEADDVSLMSTNSAPFFGADTHNMNNISASMMNEDMPHSNGHISSSLATLASASSSISVNNVSDNIAKNETYFDFKQDHICSPERLPLIPRQELDNHKSEVWYCKFSNDGTKLATGGVGGKIKIWHVEPNEPKLIEKCTLDCNSYSITCLSWSPDDVYLLSCGSEDKPDLFIWNVNKEESHRMISHSDDESTTTCSWHLSGQKFAAASIKGNFNVYDLDGNRHGTREGVRVQCLQFLNKDPNYILAADTLNRIKSYAIKDMSLDTDEEDILEEKNCIMSFTIDQDDKYIAVNVREQGVHLWSYRLKTLLRTFAGVCQRQFAIYSSFSSPRANLLATGSEDGIIYIYNITNNGSIFNESPIAKLYGHRRCVSCVSWNPKFPHLLASVSDDRHIRLWAPLPIH